jgi:acetylornithine deacetylase
MNVNSLLLDLIKIESFSLNETNVCNYVYDFLKKHKFDAKKQFVTKNTFNIIVKIGKPKIYFSAHLDTVKPFLKAYQTKDKIFGRGACDTKSSVACMLTAAILAKEKGYTNFGLIFTVDEEYTFTGVKKLVKTEKIPFVIVGEPSDCNIFYGNFGGLVLKLQTIGKKAHSKDPKKGINAIDKMIDILPSVKDVCKDSNLKDLCSNMSIVMINGGIAENIIPDFCEAKLSFRLSPKDKTDYIKKVKNIVKNKAKVIVGLNFPSAISDIPKEINFIKKRSITKVGTELSYYKKGIVIGPGSLEFAHKDNEQIKKSELKKATNIYFKIIENYQSS